MCIHHQRSFFFFNLLILYDPHFLASAATHPHSYTLDLTNPNCSSSERTVSDLHFDHSCPPSWLSPHFFNCIGASNLLTPISPFDQPSPGLTSLSTHLAFWGSSFQPLLYSIVLLLHLSGNISTLDELNCPPCPCLHPGVTNCVIILLGATETLVSTSAGASALLGNCGGRWSSCFP